MAKCTVERLPPVEPPIEKVILELTPEEAGMVRRLVGHCGCASDLNDPVHSVYWALERAGIKPAGKLTGSIQWRKE